MRLREKWWRPVSVACANTGFGEAGTGVCYAIPEECRPSQPCFGCTIPGLCGAHAMSGDGRCKRRVKRVVRSTNVPIPELCNPRIKSPSQCPGTARSSTAAGRALINTSGVTKPLPRRPCAPAERATRVPSVNARSAPDGARHALARTALDRSPRD